MKTIWYSVDGDERLACSVDDYLLDPSGEDLELVAAACAQNLFDEHDGWECTWPMELRLFREEDDELCMGVWIVDREDVPHFYARRRADGQDNGQVLGEGVSDA